MAIKKTYQYKIYNPQNVYLGLLPNPTSDFGYNQTLSSAAVQITVTVPLSADNIRQAPSPILDESGNQILDETGAAIYDERAPDVVGYGNSNALIANDNLIRIYEFSQYYPNGTIVFDGYIQFWETEYGGSDSIVLTCISNGDDLNNYTLLSGNSTLISQVTDDGNSFTTGLISGKSGEFVDVAQTFTIASTTKLGGATLEVTTPAAGIMTAVVYQMVGSTPNPQVDIHIDGSVLNLPLITTKTVVTFAFTNNETMVPGTYYIDAGWSFDGFIDTANIFCSTSNPYAGGTAWTLDFNGSSWTATQYAGDDLYFTILQYGGNTTATYTKQDLAIILTNVMQNYVAQGGLLTIPFAETLPIIGDIYAYFYTGVTTTYTFKMQTILQVIQTIATFAPADWYWYGDPGTGILQAKLASTTADITFVKGKHINNLKLKATKSNIKNNAYFTGGDDGTNTNTNILVNVSVPQGNNRVGLAFLNDNRVKNTLGLTDGTVIARQIAQAYLDQNDDETFMSTITIQDGTMDTNLIKLGMMAGFAGFGTFPDSLLLQIVGIQKTPDQVILQIGTLPKRVAAAVQAINAQLTSVQVAQNPTTPS